MNDVAIYSNDRDHPRRLDRLVLVGSAVIAGLSTLLMRAQPAAAVGCLGEPDCCHLATCTWCNYNVSPDRFYCPTGYNRFTWSCVDSGTGNLVWCGECTTSTLNCFNGSFTCSAWFWN